MRFVLDEGVPRQLARRLREFGIDATAFRQEWRGLKNGVLIRQLAVEGFEGLITCDQSLLSQQAHAALPLAVLSLPGNRRSTVLAAAAAIASTLVAMQRRDLVEIRADGTRVGRRFVDADIVALDLEPLEPFGN